MLCLSSASTAASDPAQDIGGESVTPHVEIVTVPLVERAAFHHEYANTLLRLALDLTVEEYGPYKIRLYDQKMSIRRQLIEIAQGDKISVALSMPMPKWLEGANVVRFPLLKGLPSYRLFFTLEKNQPAYPAIQTLSTLKTLKIGQGRGWSTAAILEANEFEVVYSETYKSLFAMLKAERFHLLMRGVYEIEAELGLYQQAMPELAIAENFAVYTYLPMYFFVNKRQPLLAERLEKGLKLAHANGQVDDIFVRYFTEAVDLLKQKDMKIFYLSNTNINNTFLQHDHPYLLSILEE